MEEEDETWLPLLPDPELLWEAVDSTLEFAAMPADKPWPWPWPWLWRWGRDTQFTTGDCLYTFDFFLAKKQRKQTKTQSIRIPAETMAPSMMREPILLVGPPLCLWKGGPTLNQSPSNLPALLLSFHISIPFNIALLPGDLFAVGPI